MNDNEDGPQPSGLLRSTACFLVALALLLSGLGILFGALISPQPVKMLVFFVAIILACAGGSWLWSDFVRPSRVKRPG
jgi:uncharacterized membrane protein SpoIIM required for sporulation